MVEIIQYPDMSQLSDDRLHELVKQEREWFGYRGFGEYVICTNPKCRRVLSIDDVYGTEDTHERYVPLEKLEKQPDIDLRCPDCDAKAEFIMDPELMSRFMAEYFKQRAYGALLLEDGRIEGSSVAFVAPAKEAVESINYRNTYDVEYILQQIAEKTRMTLSQAAIEPAVCWNRLGLSRNMRERGGQNFTNLSMGVLDQHPEYDNLILLCEVNRHSNSYPLQHAFGYETLQEGSYGGLVVMHKQTGAVRRAISLDRKTFERELGARFAEGREIQKQYNQLHPIKDEKRYYKGIPLVPEMLLNLGVRTNDVPDASAFETDNGIQIRIENYTSKEIPEEVLKEISDYFRYIFANAFGQYLVYPSEGKPISAAEVFGTSDEYVSIKDLDNFNLDSYPRHPVTGEKAVFWHDPETTLQRFNEKFKEHAYFTIFRDIKTGKLLGLIFGHKTTVKGMFETEEWEDPLHYAAVRSPNQRNFDQFLTRTNEERVKLGLQPFTAESEIYASNCVATDPTIRGIEQHIRLTSAYFKSLPREILNKLELFVEVQNGSKLHSMFRVAGAYEIPGVLSEKEILEPGDLLLMGAPVKTIAALFTSSPKEVEKKLAEHAT